MANLTASAILAVFGIILFVYIYVGDVKRALRKKVFWSSSISKASLIIVVASVVSIGLVFNMPRSGLLPSNDLLVFFATVLAGLTSFIWSKYIRSIDIFEPERRRYLFLVFAMACLTVFLVFPISDLIKSTGFNLNGDPLNDFLYSTITIGSVEEIVKIIPVLLLLAFSSQINEPIDFIVYGSMSALGFAFIENILYLVNTELLALSGRLLYSSVAHMFFTSIICYKLAIGKIKRGKINALDFFSGLILASLGHGFYDFWLINEAFYFPLITTFFFLGSLHVWVLMKNNLINQSNFYNATIELDRQKLQYELTSMIVLVFFLGYILIGVQMGSVEANKVLFNGFINYLFVLVYITATFSSYNIIKGYVAPIRFPIKFFAPKVEAYPDYVGSEIVLHSPRQKNKRNDLIHGKLIERRVVGQDYNWYLFRAETTFKYYLLRPLTFERGFSRSEFKKVKMCLLDSEIDVSSTVIDKKKLLSCSLHAAYLK